MESFTFYYRNLEPDLIKNVHYNIKILLEVVDKHSEETNY